MVNTAIKYLNDNGYKIICYDNCVMFEKMDTSSFILYDGNHEQFMTEGVHHYKIIDCITVIKNNLF